MPGLRQEHWNDMHEIKIKEFLTNPEKRLLVLYLEQPLNDEDSPKLIAQNEIKSLGPNEQFTYFVKSYYSQEINNKEAFSKNVQYGTFGGKHLQSLLRLSSGLYAPLFFDNKSWPDSIDKFLILN